MSSLALTTANFPALAEAYPRSYPSVAKTSRCLDKDEVLERNFIKFEELAALFETYITKSPLTPTTFIQSHLQQICQKVNDMIQRNEVFAGKSTKLPDDDAPTQCCHRKPTEEKAPICWIEMPEDKETIDLLVISSTKLPMGHYKINYKARMFKIPLNLSVSPDSCPPKTFSSERKIQCIPFVFKRVIKSPSSREDQKNEKLLTVQKGQLLHEKIWRIVPSNIAKPAEPRLPDFKANAPVDCMRDTKQIWYNSDLDDAFHKKKVPLDISASTKYQSFSLTDALKVMVDISFALEKMHEAGCVHSDVSFANILIKIEESGVFEGYLSDFDLASNTFEAFREYRKSAPRWDTLRKKGFTHYALDAYSLAMLLWHILDADFSKYDKPECSGQTDPGRDFNVKTVLARVATAKANNLSPPLLPLQQKISISSSPEDIIHAFDMQTLTPFLKSDGQRKLVEGFGKEIELTYQILCFVGKIIKQSYALDNFLINNPQIQKLLADEDPEVRTEAAKILQERSLPMKEIRKELTALYEQAKNISPPTAA